METGDELLEKSTKIERLKNSDGRINSKFEQKPSSEKSKIQRKKFKPIRYRPWNINEITGYCSGVFEKDPETITCSRYCHRKSNDMGDIDALANSMKNHGQLQACLVRDHPTKPKFYELIIGKRRLLAAKKAGLKLKVVIEKLTDGEAKTVYNESNRWISN